MSYTELSARERISCVHIDLMSDKEFSRIGPVTQIGNVFLSGAERPTAGTDGLDTWYNEQWVMRLSREQLRAIVAHEQLHKMLMHCTLYNAEFRQYPAESAMAVDYVVNLVVADLDKGRGFIQWPTDFPPLLDEQYRDMSCLEVLDKLLRNPPQGGGRPMDQHQQREPGNGDPEGAKQEAQLIDDARMQGEINSSRLRGVGAGSASLKGFERTETEWRGPLQQFMQEHMEGDEQSRWHPPNKLFRPLGIMLPSHYSEAAGDIVVACDTSASMMLYYARIFGEIGRICEQVRPLSLTVIWWDSKVAGTQKFGPSDYGNLKDKLAAKGGGGTTVSCVAAYMAEHRMRPKATIMLTDGYVERHYVCPPGPLLWGVVGHANFTPLRGKLLRIGKETL